MYYVLISSSSLVLFMYYTNFYNKKSLKYVVTLKI